MGGKRQAGFWKVGNVLLFFDLGAGHRDVCFAIIH